MKARLKGAQTGRNLLKKKADALSMRFRQILRKIIEVSWLWICPVIILNGFPEGGLCLMPFPQTKTKMGEVMREAAFSLAEAKFTAGDFR